MLTVTSFYINSSNVEFGQLHLALHVSHDSSQPSNSFGGSVVVYASSGAMKMNPHLLSGMKFSLSSAKLAAL